jgi:hypothetical protein
MVTLFLTMLFLTEMSMESPQNPCGIVLWNPPGMFHGIQGGYAPIPYGNNHSIILPCGIHDVHGIRN